MVVVLKKKVMYIKQRNNGSDRMSISPFEKEFEID